MRDLTLSADASPLAVLIARVLLNELALQRRIKNYKLRSPSEASAPSPNVFSNITSPFMTPDPAVKA